MPQKSTFLCMTLISCTIFLTSCTYSISMSMAHTEGQASDVIDDTLSPQNNVSPDISVPLVGK